MSDDKTKAIVNRIATKVTKSDDNDSDIDRDSDGLDFQIEHQRAKTARYLSNTKDRQWLAEWSTGVVSIWLFFVLLIVINSNSLKLSDAVLGILLGTTTLNVLGLTAIVLRGHFSSRE